MGWTFILLLALCTVNGSNLGETNTSQNATCDCESDPPGINCRGSLSQTSSGFTCQTWSTRWQNWPSFLYNGSLADETLDHNYCRNPGGLRSAAWCFTTDLNKQWEDCSVGPLDSDMSGSMTCKKIFALGMEVGRITDSAITASSEYNTYTRAAHGRLNNNFSWRPKEDEHPWIQVDLSYPNNIIGIGTQGGYGNDKDGWVTSYVVGCGENNVTFNNISAQNDSIIFQANSNSNITRFNSVHPVTPCRFIRIYINGSHNYPAMRVEIYGDAMLKRLIRIESLDLRTDSVREGEHTGNNITFDVTVKFLQNIDVQIVLKARLILDGLMDAEQEWKFPRTSGNLALNISKNHLEYFENNTMDIDLKGGPTCGNGIRFCVEAFAQIAATGLPITHKAISTGQKCDYIRCLSPLKSIDVSTSTLVLSENVVNNVTINITSRFNWNLTSLDEWYFHLSMEYRPKEAMSLCPFLCPQEMNFSLANIGSSAEQPLDKIDLSVDHSVSLQSCPSVCACITLKFCTTLYLERKSANNVSYISSNNRFCDIVTCQNETECPVPTPTPRTNPTQSDLANLETLKKKLDSVLEGNDTSSVITNEVKQERIKRIAKILDDRRSTIDTHPNIIKREGIEIQAQVFDRDEEQVIKEFGAGRRAVAVGIPLSSIISENASTTISGVFAVLSGEFFHFTNASVAGREGFGELNSDILIILISGITTSPFRENVTLTLPLLKPPDEDYQPTCAFMIESGGSLTWSTDGCTRKDDDYANDDNGDDEDDDVIICSCNHLTNFAILMLTDDVNSAEHNERLSVITYIGTSISLVSLIIALIILFSVRIYSTRIFLIKNQCIAMFVAQILFISGVEHARNIKVLCGLVAGFTHFAFLSVFCWMLGQGIYILLQLGYEMLSKVRMKKRHYALFGWGLPALIVGLTAAIKSGLYTSGSYCWLSTEEGGVWAFIGPVIAILVVSMSAFFCAMWSFSSVKAFKNKSEMDKLWSSLRAITILAPTLGLTWLFGIFVNLHVSFQYIFAILNSLQGFLLLVFQVAANDEIRTKLKLRVRRVVGRDIELTSERRSTFAQPGCSHAEKDKHLPKSAFVSTTTTTSDI